MAQRTTARMQLAPLGENGNLQYKKAIFDFKTDSEVVLPVQTANKDSILIMDGVFLFRPELVNYWDLEIFVEADFKITISRATKRDGYYLGAKQEILNKYNQRYVPGQQLYFQEANPHKKADIIIENSDFKNPVITKRFARLHLASPIFASSRPSGILYQWQTSVMRGH